MNHFETRRTIVSALATVPFAMVPIAAAAPNTRSTRWRQAYTAKTAPDPTSRAILSRSLKRINEGGGDFRQSVHRNLPQLVEQNIARMDVPRMTRWLSTAGELELRMTAQLYTTASMDSGGSMALLDVMAHRLTGKQLGMVSQYFGFAPVYQAILRTAPGKSTEFQANTSPSYLAPVYGEVAFAPAIRAGSAKLGKQGPEFLDMTIYEIYLSFRTAPFGGLSVAAALYETGMAIWKPVGIAFGFGWAIGTGLGGLIQTFAPSVYDRAGDAIFDFLDNMLTTPPPDEGPAQQELGLGAELFNLGNDMGDAFADTGGDFYVVDEWREWAGGSGGGGICWDCVLV